MYKGKESLQSGEHAFHSKEPFFSLFSSFKPPTAFAVVKRPPSLHFHGELTQELLHELTRVELLRTSRACSTRWLGGRANIILGHKCKSVRIQAFANLAFC